MIALVAMASAFGGGEVAVVEGTLRPGRIGTLQVARTPLPATASETMGAPGPLADLGMQGASVLRTRTVRPGIVELEVVPHLDATRLEIRLGEVRFRYPVVEVPPTPLEVPARVAGRTQQDDLSFLVRSTTTPGLSTDDVGVYPSEGTATLASGDKAGQVVVTLQTEKRSAPRVIPTLVIDHRGLRRPVMVPVVLRAQPSLSVSAEAGSTLVLEVGRRTYGPVEVPQSGKVSIRVDQYPGEAVARVRASDDLGNTNTSERSLATTQQPSLVIAPAGRWVPGEPPPPVHVVALRPSGAPWSEAPSCQTPQIPLDLQLLEPGWWSIAFPNGGDYWRSAKQDLRIACTVGEVTRSIRVELMHGVPERLSLEVIPEDLRSEYPVAELRAVVEDVRGDRLDVRGLAVVANHGEVVVRDQSSTLRGEYQGQEAVSHEGDRIIATYQQPPGPGPVTDVELGFGGVPGVDGGPLTVYARALNARREPVAFVPLRVRVDSESRSVMTQADGWASTTLDVPGSREPRLISAETAVATRRALAIPGESGVGGPDQADLRIEKTVGIRAGRLGQVSVNVEPKVLRAGPGTMANIVVRLEDRSGRPVTDEPPTLEASEGRILPLFTRPDGTLIAQFVPSPSRQARVVQITASVEGGVKYTTEIAIEPRGTKATVGPFVGIQTNFGRLRALQIGADVDIRARSRLLGDALMIRIGLHGTTSRSTAILNESIETELRSTMTSLDLAASLRDDRGPVSLWVGIGGSAAIQWSSVAFDEIQALLGRDLVAGPMALAGLSRRTPVGELLFEARGYLIPAPADQDIGYTGNLGGVTVGVGYRLVY
ncbi:MAG: hypothetical protein AAGA48_29325 [Myxococcota bacterium]